MERDWPAKEVQSSNTCPFSGDYLAGTVAQFDVLQSKEL